MNNLKEQQFTVKFCVKLGKSTTEMFAMLNTAYGDVAMKRVTCFRWHKRFKNGRLSVEDDERSNVLPHQLMTHTLMKSTLWCERIDV